MTGEPFAEFRQAMPVGSDWMTMNHVSGETSGPYKVAAHAGHFMELGSPELGRRIIAYPLASQWKLDRDHIRMGWNGKLRLTFAPA